MSIHSTHAHDIWFGVLGYITGSAAQGLFWAGVSAVFTGACSAAGAIMLHIIYRKFIKKQQKDGSQATKNNRGRTQ